MGEAYVDAYSAASPDRMGRAVIERALDRTRLDEVRADKRDRHGLR